MAPELVVRLLLRGVSAGLVLLGGVQRRAHGETRSLVLGDRLARQSGTDRMSLYIIEIDIFV